MASVYPVQGTLVTCHSLNLGERGRGSGEKDVVWLGWSHQVLGGHLVPPFLHTLHFPPLEECPLAARILGLGVEGRV